jgi:hypothetical protein
MNNSRLNKISLLSALVFNSLLLLGALYFLSGYAQGQDMISFVIKETNPEEDETAEVAAALGYNLTSYEILNNGTIVVNATR